MPFAALLGNPKLIMIGLVVLAVGGYIGWLKFDIWGLERDIDKLNVQVTQLQADVEFAKSETRQCLGKIDERNARINDLKDAKAHRAEVLDLLADNIDAVHKVTESKINDIENLATPENCEQAMELLRQGVK